MLRQAPRRAPGSPAAVSLGDRYAAGSERGKTGFHSAILVGQWHAVARPASSVPGCARGRRWIPRKSPAPKPEPTVGACCKPGVRISSHRERFSSGKPKATRLAWPPPHSAVHLVVRHASVHDPREYLRSVTASFSLGHLVKSKERSVPLAGHPFSLCHRCSADALAAVAATLVQPPRQHRSSGLTRSCTLRAAGWARGPRDRPSATVREVARTTI